MSPDDAASKTSPKSPSPNEKAGDDVSTESTAVDVNLKELMRKQEELDRAAAGDDEEVTPTDADAAPKG